MIDDGEGAWWVAQIERLQFEMEGDATGFDRIEATFAATKQGGAIEPLVYEGKRQVLPDLGVRVTVYPSWHESPYRWVMSVFEERDGERRLWVDAPLRLDGKALYTAAASVAASLFRPQAGTRVGHRARGRRGVRSYTIRSAALDR